MIQWGEPRVLPWLWALLPLAGLLLFLLGRRETRLRLILDDGASALLSPRRRPALVWAKAALWFVACALVLVALCRPRWGIRWQEERRRGLDILVVLDASESMRATDVAPSRLQLAKWGVSDLLRKLSGDRAGLVVFAGSSFLACPLTTDYAAFSMTLEDVHPGIIPRGGTSLASALETALRSFEHGGNDDRAIVLISDGEDHEGGVEQAVAALAQARVRVFAVGVGTAGRGTIPAADGAPGALLRDRSGNVVRTALREDALQRIAVATGGVYVRATADDSGMERVFSLGISRLRRDEKESKLVKVFEERFPWFLGAAVLLLSLEAILGEQRERRKTGRPKTRALLVALIVLAPAAFAAPAPAAGARGAMTAGFALFEARDYEPAARSFEEAAAEAAGEGLDPAVARYDRGCALLKAGKSLEAAAAFAAALGAPASGLAAKAHYNRGIALVTAAEAAETNPGPAAAVGLLDQALASFESAMLAAPDDEDPKVNHELAARRKALLEEKIGERQKQRGGGAQPPPAGQARSEERPQGMRPQRPEATGNEMKPEEARTMLDAMKQQEMSQRRRIGPPRGETAPVDKAW